MSWKKVKLGDVCELITRGISPKYTDKSGIAVINQKCIRNHSINYDLVRFPPPPKNKNEMAKKKPILKIYIKERRVLVDTVGVGTLGRVAQVRAEVNKQIAVDSHVTIIRPIQNLFFNDFFGYSLILIENQIQSSGRGTSGQIELSRQDLNNKFYISYPESHEEQKRIVAKLDAVFGEIDKAIEIETKQLDNYEVLQELPLILH